MKTFDKKDVFTIVTAEEAIAYIGKRGYFGDSFKELESNINKDCGDNLGEVCTDRYTSIVFRPYTCETSYGLFIPTDKVKEVEEPKKWRAFKDFNEFKFWTGKGIGSVIVYRDKLTNDELEAVITRSKLYENFVEIGAVEYTFKELFDQWEWLSNRNEWQPFGVEE